MIVKSKIKKGDKVIIIAGKDKDKTGEVLKVYPKELRLLVQGVNVYKKHQKPSAKDAGGMISKELPLHISNVAFLDPKQSKATKIGYKVENGQKVRYCKLSGTVLDT